MNRKPEPRTRLLAEVFHDDWSDGPASAFARAAAAHARRRRRVRQALVTIGATAGLAAVFAFTLLHPATPPPRPSVARIAPAYELISDEEFLAELQDQPLLVLPAEQGPRKFVLLDR